MNPQFKLPSQAQVLYESAVQARVLLLNMPIMIQAQVLDYESAHLKLKSYYDYESVVQVQAQVLLL